MLPVYAEIDQSGRMEFTRDDTVLALANSMTFSVLIPAPAKRTCVQKLRARGKSGPTLYLQLFATGLFFLLHSRIGGLTQVVIDIEYAGNEARIKEHLINLLRRAGDVVTPNQIRFDRLGRKSPAHRVALQTFRRESRPDLVLTAGDLLGQFRG